MEPEVSKALNLSRATSAPNIQINQQDNDNQKAQKNPGIVSCDTIYNGSVNEPVNSARDRGSPEAQQNQPLPDVGHEEARQSKKSATLSIEGCDLDDEEVHLSLMAAVAGREVAMRAAMATENELKRLRDIRRLWDLRLDLHQKLKAAEQLPDPLQTPAQYRLASSLVTTQNDVRKLEEKLFGLAHVSKKNPGATEAKRRMSAYEKTPPGLAA